MGYVIVPSVAWMCLLLTLTTPTVQAESISFSVDDWCPYTCLDSASDGDGKTISGYYYDILKAIYEPMGHEVAFHVRPWKRALVETRVGTLDCLLSPTRDEAPSLVFPEEEIGCLQWCFYTLADAGWTYDGVDSLKGQTMGYLEGNFFSKSVNDYIALHAADADRVQPVFGLDFLEQNISKLRAGRITVLVDESTVMDYHLAQHGLEPLMRKAGCMHCQPMYPAFSPAVPAAHTYAALFTEGMRYLRETGKLDAILSRYGLKDWRMVPDSIE